jgi:hypothetical protein
MNTGEGSKMAAVRYVSHYYTAHHEGQSPKARVGQEQAQKKPMKGRGRSCAVRNCPCASSNGSVEISLPGGMECAQAGWSDGVAEDTEWKERTD